MCRASGREPLAAGRRETSWPPERAAPRHALPQSYGRGRGVSIRWIQECPAPNFGVRRSPLWRCGPRAPRVLPAPRPRSGRHVRSSNHVHSSRSIAGPGPDVLRAAAAWAPDADAPEPRRSSADRPRSEWAAERHFGRGPLCEPTCMDSSGPIDGWTACCPKPASAGWRVFGSSRLLHPPPYRAVAEESIDHRGISIGATVGE